MATSCITVLQGELSWEKDKRIFIKFKERNSWQITILYTWNLLIQMAEYASAMRWTTRQLVIFSILHRAFYLKISQSLKYARSVCLLFFNHATLLLRLLSIFQAIPIYLSFKMKQNHAWHGTTSFYVLDVVSICGHSWDELSWTSSFSDAHHIAVMFIMY